MYALSRRALVEGDWLLKNLKNLFMHLHFELDVTPDFSASGLIFVFVLRPDLPYHLNYNNNRIQPPPTKLLYSVVVSTSSICRPAERCRVAVPSKKSDKIGGVSMLKNSLWQNLTQPTKSTHPIFYTYSK